jgi:hypothetical protein
METKIFTGNRRRPVGAIQTVAIEKLILSFKAPKKFGPVEHADTVSMRVDYKLVGW